MPNFLFNRFGAGNQSSRPPAAGNNIISQLAQIKRNPSAILDILLQNGKITQSQYNDLQPYKNNPEMIGRYLMNSGHAGEINQAQQMANQMGLNSNV